MSTCSHFRTWMFVEHTQLLFVPHTAQTSTWACNSKISSVLQPQDMQLKKFFCLQPQMSATGSPTILNPAVHPQLWQHQRWVLHTDIHTPFTQDCAIHTGLCQVCSYHLGVFIYGEGDGAYPHGDLEDNDEPLHIMKSHLENLNLNLFHLHVYQMSS